MSMLRASESEDAYENIVLFQAALLQIGNSGVPDRVGKAKMTAEPRFELFAVRFISLADRDLAARR